MKRNLLIALALTVLIGGYFLIRATNVEVKEVASSNTSIAASEKTFTSNLGSSGKITFNYPEDWTEIRPEGYPATVLVFTSIANSAKLKSDLEADMEHSELPASPFILADTAFTVNIDSNSARNSLEDGKVPTPFNEVTTFKTATASGTRSIVNFEKQGLYGEYVYLENEGAMVLFSSGYAGAKPNGELKTIFDRVVASTKITAQ